jgi:hypothetical protein
VCDIRFCRLSQLSKHKTPICTKHRQTHQKSLRMFEVKLMYDLMLLQNNDSHQLPHLITRYCCFRSKRKHLRVLLCFVIVMLHHLLIVIFDYIYSARISTATSTKLHTDTTTLQAPLRPTTVLFISHFLGFVERDKQTKKWLIRLYYYKYPQLPLHACNTLLLTTTTA